MPLCADPTVPILPKIQGNLTGFVVEAEHPGGRGFTPRRQVNKATKVPEAKSNEKSDLDIVRLMEVYRLSNTSPQTSLNQRVQVNDISVGIDIGFEHIVNSTAKELTMHVLHGAPTEHDVCTKWYKVEELKQFQVILVNTVHRWKPISQQI